MTKRKKMEPIDDEAAAAAKEAERALCEFRKIVVGPVSDYARYVMVPRVLAERRRRQGDNTASPHDYECSCDLDRADELPICRGYRPACKFAHRAPPPGPYWSDGFVKHKIHREEQQRMMDELAAADDDAAFRATLIRIDNALEAANRRMKAAGSGFSRSDGWWC